MIEVNFANISIKQLGSSSGLFIGNTNTLKSFQNKKEKFEVIGVLNGAENKLVNNKWYQTKSREGS